MAVDNNGIGALFGTFEIAKTNDEYDLTIDDVGKAVVLAGGNLISYGSLGGNLLGLLEHVSGGLSTVQLSGVARFKYNESMPIPIVGGSVLVDGDGCVYRHPGDLIHNTTVINVDDIRKTCDVLL